MNKTTPPPTGMGEYSWPLVLCLLGLDYFSTLAYQPSLTFDAAGRLGPVATAGVVLATLLGALPVYFYLAGRTPGGRGSLGVLERFVRGWRGKTLVLILLGFAATDFTMLKSLSLADAAVHLLHNPHPLWREQFHGFVHTIRDAARYWFDDATCQQFDAQLVATLLIGAVAFVFWFILRRGFNRNALILAVPIVGLYLTLTILLLLGSLWQIHQRPELVVDYLEMLNSGNWALSRNAAAGYGWLGALALSVLVLPKLALGLSGFELSMILSPQVRGRDATARVANVRRVLVTSAVLMGGLLLTSSFVVTLLIPVDAFHGAASNRALAYLAHGEPLVTPGFAVLPFCGPWFGSLYDASTILILAFAGTSVMTALASLLPQFMLRFGMEFRWTHRWGVMILLFAAISIVATAYFQADVNQQRDAYATGVVALIVSACAAGFLDLRHEARQFGGFSRQLGVTYFLTLGLGFFLVLLAVILNGGGGLMIAGLFISAILGMSVLSRVMRADELRTIGFSFKDEASKEIWENLRRADFPLLVPHRPGLHARAEKEGQVRQEHSLSPVAVIVFLEIQLGDPSDFFQNLDVEVFKEDEKRFVIRVTGGVSVAHSIAAVALEMSRVSRPPSLHFGWPGLNLLEASWSYLAFGEGNIPWKVRELIGRAEPEASKRPRVVVG